MQQVNNLGTYKRTFTPKETYRIVSTMPAALRALRKAKQQHILSSTLIERIMLAVTEVNGCALCSYAHTRMALQEGLAEEEIAQLLTGSSVSIPPEEAPAIVFAQHFAEGKGLYDPDMYMMLTRQYSPEKAQGILGSAQVILTGNAYGIPYSAFFSRLRGKPYRNSTIWYELGMILFGIFIMPIAFIHGFFLPTSAPRQ
jgi:AhpD family alkylhydroperoxidase